MINLFHFYV